MWNCIRGRPEMRTSEQTAKETLPIICTGITCALLVVVIIFLILNVSGIAVGPAAGSSTVPITDRKSVV